MTDLQQSRHWYLNIHGFEGGHLFGAGGQVLGFTLASLNCANTATHSHRSMSSVPESTDCQCMQHTCLHALSDTFITFHESVVPDMTPSKHMQANLFKNSLARQLAYATMGT